MAAFCVCCGAEITRKAEACVVCGTPLHGMMPAKLSISTDILKPVSRDTETREDNSPRTSSAE